MRTKDWDRIEKRIREIVLDVLNETYGGSANENIQNNHLPPFRDVNNIKLQRMKHTEKQLMRFKLGKPRSKWELIKSLQEEFDKFPDDAVFTSFFALGIGIGRSTCL